jgi:hypothetical protein
VGNVDGRCGEATNRCLLPEQVFVDGKALTRAPSGQQPKSGQFALDGKRHVLLADDPKGHTVEVSTRTTWVKSLVDGVVVEGMTMRHAANDALTGALSNDGHSNAVIGGDSWSNLSLAWLTDGTGVLNDPASNNHGVNNRVWCDQGDSDMTRDEMVRALSSASVPTNSSA